MPSSRIIIMSRRMNPYLGRRDGAILAQRQEAKSLRQRGPPTVSAWQSAAVPSPPLSPPLPAATEEPYLPTDVGTGSTALSPPNISNASEYRPAATAALMSDRYYGADSEEEEEETGRTSSVSYGLIQLRPGPQFGTPQHHQRSLRQPRDHDPTSRTAGGDEPPMSSIFPNDHIRIRPRSAPLLPIPANPVGAHP